MASNPLPNSPDPSVNLPALDGSHSAAGSLARNPALIKRRLTQAETDALLAEVDRVIRPAPAFLHRQVRASDLAANAIRDHAAEQVNRSASRITYAITGAVVLVGLASVVL